MSRKIEKTKEVIAKIVKESISQFLWNWSFDIIPVASRLEFRAIKGKDWTADLLELVLNPYREHVKRQGYDEARVDGDLKVLAEKIDVPIDVIRKQYYAFEFEQPSKEEPKTPQKVQTARPSETSEEPTEKEEIELEG